MSEIKHSGVKLFLLLVPCELPVALMVQPGEFFLKPVVFKMEVSMSAGKIMV